MKLVLKIIFIICIGLPISSWSQDILTIRDIGVWASVGVNYTINTKWKTTLSQEFRTFDNAIKLKTSITDLELGYRINRQFKLGTGLRYAYSRKSDYTFTNDIRYNVDFKYKLKLKKGLYLNYRFRFQQNHINLFTYISDLKKKSNARNRLHIEYVLNKHSLFFATELFREYITYKKPRFNNVRLSIGDKVKTKLGNIKYGLLFEHELNREHPLNLFILKFNYTFKYKYG